MKYLFKFIGWVIGIIIIVVVGVIAYVGVSISDSTDQTNQEIVNINEPLDSLLNKYAYEALVDCPDNKKIDFLLDEYQLNTILYAISQKIEIPYVNLKSIYCEYMSDGSVVFFAPIDCFGFKSCIKGKLDISLENDVFTIKLFEAKFGKLSSNNFFIHNFIIKNINFDEVTTSLKNEGIFLTIKQDNNSIFMTITKQELTNMLIEKSSDEYQNLYVALIEEFVFNNKIMSFLFNDESKIGVELSLENLINKNVMPYNLQPSCESVKAKVNTLINNNVVDYTNVSIVFDYLVRGYNNISEENQKIIDNINMSSIEITNVKLYDGLVQRDVITMGDVIRDNIPENLTQILLNESFDMRISSENINKILNSLGFIGTTFAFTNGLDNDYFSISSLFISVKNNQLNIHLIMDFNGLNVSCDAIFDPEESNSSKIILTLNNFYLGEEMVKEEAQLSILKYLEEVTNTENLKFMIIDSENKQVTFDFSTYLEGNSEFMEALILAKFKNFSTGLDSDRDGFIISISK